jgi:hypothetical protein
MSNPDPVAMGTAIAAALADKQQREQLAREAAEQRRIDDAAAVFAEAVSSPTAAPVNTTNDIVEKAKVFIANAEADPGVEFNETHLRMFLKSTFPAASAADIEAAITAAEGS